MTPIHFGHANGFPSRTYKSFFDLLSPHPIRFVDCLGHGDHQVKKNWRPIGDEIIDSVESQFSEPVIGLGHSLGAASTFFAAQKRPDLFSAIIMMDPPIMRPAKRIAYSLSRSLGLLSVIRSPAQKAKKRRQKFGSHEEAYQYWRNKSLFKNFDEDCFGNYVTHGLKPEGEGYTLTFSAEVEYKIFCTAPGLLGKTKLEVPSFFIYSNKYQVLNEKDIAANKRVFSNTSFIEAEGGHMFPLEYPKKTAELVLSVIEEELSKEKSAQS